MKITTYQIKTDNRALQADIKLLEDDRLSVFTKVICNGDVVHSTLSGANSLKGALLSVLRFFARYHLSAHTDRDDNFIDQKYFEQIKQIKQQITDAKIKYYQEQLKDVLKTVEFEAK
jgi:hypothetical protein